MFNRIWHCCFLVGTRLTTIAGGASTLIGAAQQYLGVSGLPAWFWWALAILLMLATAVRVQWELLQEQDRNRKPEPNMSLEDVVKRIRGKEDVFGPEHSESMEVLRAFKLLTERGATGAITIFGSKGVRYVKPEFTDVALTRLPIPAEFWQTNTFDYSAFLDDRSGVTRNETKPHELGSGYGYIWFDRQQINAIWPPRRRTLDWKNPFRFRENL
jgi:hypothetical protein